MAMKRVLAICLIVLAPSAHAQGAVAEDVGTQAPVPFLGGFLKETRVIYPLRVDDWEAGGEHRYDQAELGVSVRYQQGKRRDRWVDVYFYPAGAVPPSQLDRDVSQTLEGIRTHAGTPGGYQQLAIDPVQPFAFELGPSERRQRIEGRSVSLRFEKDGRAYHSAMVLLVKDLYYVKGRFSAQAEAVSRDGVQSQLERMIEALLRETVVVSTGDCWSPPPIAAAAGRLDSMDPNAEGAVASAADHGQASVVAYADRVEAPDPLSPQASSMQPQAASMSGRRAEGCLPAEDLNLEVPPGRREIRIEYRVPRERGDGTTPRLRGQRSGLG